MKTLIFARHAKSSWKDASISDLERPLKERGLNDVALIAEVLEKLNVQIDLMVTSHAVRAFETAKTFASHLSYDLAAIDQKERLYHAFYHDVLDIIQGLGDENDTVMIIGHNPTATNFANKFSKEYIANVPTSGTLLLEADINSWKDFSQYNVELKHFWFPKLYRD